MFGGGLGPPRFLTWGCVMEPWSWFDLMVYTVGWLGAGWILLGPGA